MTSHSVSKASGALFAAATGAAFLAGLFYLLTMNLSFGFVDGGEMAAAAGVFGVPHPTGYPTLTLLGFLFASLLPMRTVVALNVLSVLLTAASVGVFTLLLHDLRLRAGASAAKGAPSPIPDALAALAAGLSSFWWSQGTGFEVYSLHLLLMTLSTLLFMRYVDAEAARTEGGVFRFTRAGSLFAFVLGIAFTNHVMTALLAPGFLFYYLLRLRGIQGIFFRPVALIPPFLLGLLPYAILPIRAAAHPPVNVGNVVTSEYFVDHVTGRMFGRFLFGSWEVFWQQTSYFFARLPSELGYLGGALAMAGIVALFRRNLPLAVMTLLLFAAGVVYAGGYDVVDVEPYYLTAICAVGIWIAFGLGMLTERTNLRIATAAAVATVAITGIVNYERNDMTGNSMAEDMATNMLMQAPPNALIISQQWDFWLSGSLYMQHVESMRPDVVVLHSGFLAYRWYLDELLTTRPELVAEARDEMERFRAEVAKYDSGEEYDRAALDGAYLAMVNAIIAAAIPSRPVLVTGEIDPKIGAGYARVPNYLALRLTTGEEYLPQAFPAYLFRRREGPAVSYAAKAHELYGRSLYARGLYELGHGHDSIAFQYLAYALTFDPGYDTTEIPDLPLNSEDQIVETARFFGGLRASLQSAGAPVR